MPVPKSSHLFHLNNTLTWADYGTPLKLAAPAPGKTAKAAFTRTDYSLSYGYAHDARSGGIALRDVIIKINFIRAHSWVASWVFERPKQFQNNLLTHEQGHYDIVALMARDLFNDLLALNSVTFTDKATLDQKVTALNEECNSYLSTIGSRYETETNYGERLEEQRRWSGFIHTAFTEARQPPERAPDGTPYKVRLVDVLRKNSVDLSTAAQ
jgi:hypothetical protein